MGEYLLMPRSTMEETIELLEKLESPHPTDFFLYLDILHKLKLEIHKIDIHLRLEKNVQINGSLPGRSFVELHHMIDQLGFASADSSVW